MCPAKVPPDDPITPRDLGLPPDYDPNAIPKLSDLQRASIEALDRETAFLVLHQDEPGKIIERLDKIANVSRAASQIKGPHRAKAIKLGLELKLNYWQAANKLDKWVDLIFPLLEASLDIQDRTLESRVYRAWSVYLYTTRDQPAAARQALEAATDYAHESKRADLKLLARAECLNAGVLQMSLEQAQAEAEAILAEARQLKYDYVRGKVYLSLARAYDSRILSKESFAYAQQATIFFVRLNILTLAGESALFMLGSLSYTAEGGSEHYRARLAAYLESVARRSASPILQGGVSYFQGLEHYRQGNYDNARACILVAQRQYAGARYRSGAWRCIHMVGLVQSKRGQWAMAARHLNAARTYYLSVGEDALAVEAQYALAFISYEQGDWARTRLLLEEMLQSAQQLSDEAARQQFVKNITADIESVDTHLINPDKP
jgi:hypothetical protein